MTAATRILSVHWFRRSARAEERRLQEWLDDLNTQDRAAALDAHGYPPWMRGVRVERAGRFQHAVIATDTRGH